MIKNWDIWCNFNRPCPCRRKRYRGISAPVINTYIFYDIELYSSILDDLLSFNDMDGDTTITIEDRKEKRIGALAGSLENSRVTQCFAMKSSGGNRLDIMTQFTGRKFAGYIRKPYGPISLFEKIHDVLNAESADH